MRAPAAIVTAAAAGAAAGLAVGCGAGIERAGAPAAPAAPAWTQYRDASAALTVHFPSAWHRARTSLTPTLTSPREVLSLGTFPLAPGDSGSCRHLPAGALARMGPRDVFVTLQETSAGAHHRPRARPFDMGRSASELAACYRRPTPFADFWTSFEDGGRAFYVLTAVGREAPPERRRELQAVLDRLRIDPSLRHNDLRLVLADGWALHRRRLTGAVAARDQFAFGSYRVPPAPPDANCTPRAAIAALPPGGAFVFGFEYRGLNPRQLARFPRRPPAFRLGREQPYECFGPSRMVTWRERGRAFQAHVYLGPRAGARGRREVLGALDRIRVGRRG